MLASFLVEMWRIFAIMFFCFVLLFVPHMRKKSLFRALASHKTALKLLLCIRSLLFMLFVKLWYLAGLLIMPYI